MLNRTTRIATTTSDHRSSSPSEGRRGTTTSTSSGMVRSPRLILPRNQRPGNSGSSRKDGWERCSGHCRRKRAGAILLFAGRSFTPRVLICAPPGGYAERREISYKRIDVIGLQLCCNLIARNKSIDCGMGSLQR